MTRRTSPDFISLNQGSLIILTAITQPALDWIDINTDEEAEPHLGSIYVDPRYFFDIASGLLNDGLTLQDAATGRMAELPA